MGELVRLSRPPYWEIDFVLRLRCVRACVRAKLRERDRMKPAWLGVARRICGAPSSVRPSRFWSRSKVRAVRILTDVLGSRLVTESCFGVVSFWCACFVRVLWVLVCWIASLNPRLHFCQSSFHVCFASLECFVNQCESE